MATINLYSSSSSDQWDLLPNKLFIIDDIADYLLTKTKTTLNSVQYQKNQLELTLKLDMSQSYAQADSVSNYKYLSIQNNADERIHYYFVRKVTWRSKTCVEFDLLLDVLNTFHETTDYVFKPNTKIVREHKDRYVRGLYEITISVDYLPTKTGDINEGDHVSLISRFDQKVMFSGTITEISAGFSIITIEVDGEYFDKLATIKADLAAHESSSYSLDVTNDDYLLYSAIIENDYTFNMSEHRVIDYVPEGINPMLYHVPSEDVTIEHEESEVRTDWFLVYRNQLDPSDESYVDNPVECYLFPKDRVRVYSGSIVNGVINANNLEIGQYYYLPIGASYSMTLSNGVTIDNTGGHAYRFVIIKKDNNGLISVMVVTVETLSPQPPSSSVLYNDISYITLNTTPYPYYKTSSQITYDDYYAILVGDDWNGEFDEGEITQYLDSIDGLDKSSAKLIKVIKLPYVPYNFNYVSHKLDIPNSDWIYTTLDGLYCLKLNKLMTKLHCSFEVTSGAEAFSKFYDLTLSPSLTMLRSNNYETKIYHSEFYAPTYVYDSFTLKIQLEKCDLNYFITNKAYRDVEIEFDVTRTINSRFMFTLPAYECKFSDSNFNKIFTIARNNEEVMYNIPYINYIRSGFNYDVKAKNIQNASNWAGAALGVVGGTFAALGGAVGGNVLALAGGVATIVTSLKSAIVSQAQSENSIAQRLDQLQNQVASAAGSDDVDLMSIYAKNRVIFMTYKPNEVMTNMLYDLFYYAGYNSGRIGLPNHIRRVNFDYLECEAKIESVATIPEECLKELIACFATGVTYIHKTTRTSKKWDVKQEYENWETSLMGE